MRRHLMKKMKKGYLTPGEREELRELDREVNQLNRRAGRNIGLGAAAALYAAKQTGALDSAGDALGRFLDERADIREGRKADKAKQKELEEMRTWQGDYEAEQSAKRKSEEREALKADKAKQKELEEMRSWQGDYEAEQKAAAEDLLKMARKASADEGFFDEEPESEAEPKELAVGRAREPYGVQAKRQAERERRADERLDRRLERRGGYDPRTGEVVDSAKQQAKDEEYDREFDRFYSDEELMDVVRQNIERRKEMARRQASQVLTPEEQESERFYNRSAVQGLRGRSDIPAWNTDYTGGFELTGNRPEFSSEDLFRKDGPRVEDAEGGYTPFLRSMRDKIRKKFR